LESNSSAFLNFLEKAGGGIAAILVLQKKTRKEFWQMKKTDYLTRAPKIRRIPRITLWVLELRGYLDSQFGKELCDDYIVSLYEALVKQEIWEFTKLIEVLHPVRNEVFQVLYTQQKLAARLEEVPPFVESNEPEFVRENRENIERQKKLQSRIAANEENLLRLYRIVQDDYALCDQRIHLLRDQIFEKVRHYIMGVHRGKEKTYIGPATRFDDHIKELYMCKYAEQDEMLKTIVYACLGKEDINEK